MFISINNYTSHSTRAAATSYARTRGASLKSIIDSAGWSSERTFAEFYDKDIEGEMVFQDLLMNNEPDK